MTTSAPTRQSLADWRKTKTPPAAKAKKAGPNRDSEECRKMWAHMAKICREQRLRLNMTLQEVGDAMGVTRAMINNFESGKNGLAISRIPQLAETLRIPCADLLPPEFSR